MQALTRFFWFCSGVNFSILQKVPTESNKYLGIGATVFFTGVFAALAGFYALYTVFQSWGIALVFALLWGAMIFNLDRFIVSSMRKKEQGLSEWKLALPRLVLALLLAVVISKPLELKLFEREINRKLDEQKIAFIKQSKDSLAKGFPEIQAFRAKREAEFEKQVPGINGFDGFAARMDGLAKLTEESKAMAIAELFLVLLFIAIETTPIFIKLISSRGPYDELLELHEDQVKLYKQEKWKRSSGESEARLSYFKSTHFYASDLAAASTNAENEQKSELGKKGLL